MLKEVNSKASRIPQAVDAGQWNCNDREISPVMKSVKSKLDLRHPVFAKLRRETYAVWLRQFTLLMGDLSLLTLAWVIAGTYGREIDSFWQQTNPKSLVVVLTIELSLIATQGLYQSGAKRCDYSGLAKAITYAHVLLLVIAFLYQPNNFVSRSTYLLSWVLSLAFVCFGRFAVDLLLRYLRKRGAVRYPTVLICPPEITGKAVSYLEREDCFGNIQLVDAHSLTRANIKPFVEAVQSLGIAEVFVCSWNSIEPRMFLYWSLRNAGVTLRILCLELENFYRRSNISMIGGVPTVKFCPPLITGLDFWVKRCFDFFVSVTLIILLSPVFLCIAILIKLDSPGPMFYKQERVGLHSNHFKVLKFRTMFINADKLQKELEARNEMKDGILFKMKDDPRITKVGKYLRRYSLDELPQLFNVLFGEMSLVGPRPLPVRDVSKFAEHHFIRQEVLPGITGLWQVSGRSDITDFEEVVRLDTFYMENWSVWLDLQILMRTAMVLVQKKGAY